MLLEHISPIPWCIKYHTMHHFVTELWTRLYFCYKMAYCGTWNWCIVGFVPATTAEATYVLNWPGAQSAFERRHICYSLRWRNNERDSVSNHQSHYCLLNRLFRRRSKKSSKLRVTGLCVGNLPGTGEFPAQMASYAENVSIWWRHHVWYLFVYVCSFSVVVTCVLSRYHTIPAVSILFVLDSVMQHICHSVK